MKNKIVQIIAPPAIVLMTHLVLVFLEAYNKAEWIDIPMHFAGGLAVGISFLLLIQLAQGKNHVGKLSRFALFVFIVSLVALTAVFWEFAEFIADLFVKNKFQRGLQDTLADLLLGLVGGAVSVLIRKI